MKTAGIVLAVLAALILFLMVIRAGVVLQGDLKGIRITAFRLGFLHIPLKNRKNQKQVKSGRNGNSAKNAAKPEGAESKDKEEDSWTPDLLRRYAAFAKTALEQAKRSIRVDKLSLRAKIGGSNAAAAALKYGSVAAAVSTLLPVLGDMLDLKKTEISVDADFEGGKDDVRFGLGLSGRVYRLLHAIWILRAEYKKLG